MRHGLAPGKPGPRRMGVVTRNRGNRSICRSELAGGIRAYRWLAPLARDESSPTAVDAPSHERGGMYAMLAAQRGRSANVQVYDVDLPTNLSGATHRVHGLRSSSKEFEPGDFIGFYTGRWGSRKRLGGANAYMVDCGDDHGAMRMNLLQPTHARMKKKMKTGNPSRR